MYLSKHVCGKVMHNLRQCLVLRNNGDYHKVDDMKYEKKNIKDIECNHLKISTADTLQPGSYKFFSLETKSIR